MRNITVIVLVALLAVAGFLAGQRNSKPAEVAKVRPAEASKTEGGNVVAEGRVAVYPGSKVQVASENAGIVSSMHVQEMDIVRKGQVIADLRKSDLLAAQEEARAKVLEAEADIRLAESEHRRTGDLVSRQFISRQAMDKSERDLSAAIASLASAQASLKRITAQIEKMRIVAPIDGTVVDRHVENGEAVAEGGAVVTLADLSRLRIEAEVDEFDIGRIQKNAEVVIKAEGFDGKRWRGRVEELPDAVRERGLRPQDVARPSDARILLVKIALLEPVPLKLGQRVEVSIAGEADKVAQSTKDNGTKIAM